MTTPRIRSLDEMRQDPTVAARNERAPKIRVEPAEIAYAIKARAVVRSGQFTDLTKLAEAIADGMPAALRARLTDTVEAYRAAAKVYLKVELRDGDYPEWFAAAQFRNGFIPLPAFSPPHRQHAIETWNALVSAVHDATIVGVARENRYAPISLSYDPDPAS